MSFMKICRLMAILFLFPSITVAQDVTGDHMLEFEQFGSHLKTMDDLNKENLRLKKKLSSIEKKSKYDFTFHKPNYMLPYSWQSTTDDRLHEEAKFQLSVKQFLFPLGDLDVYTAYTQKSFWQIYDQKKSRPFRETNYNPELFIKTQSFQTEYGLAAFAFGYEHESNGEKEPVSRSWDRLYLLSEFQRGPAHLALKFWYRFPEDDKEYTEDPEGDNNPDILDYYGYGDLVVNLNYDWVKFSIYGRYNASQEKGAFEASMFLLLSENSDVAFMMQYFDGYGDSLIDYNRHMNRWSIGVAVTGWNDLNY